MTGFVYFLKNKNGKYYIGSTKDIQRRLNQHRLGHTQTTKNMKSFELVFQYKYESLEKARKVERKIKKKRLY